MSSYILSKLGIEKLEKHLEMHAINHGYKKNYTVNQLIEITGVLGPRTIYKFRNGISVSENTFNSFRDCFNIKFILNTDYEVIYIKKPDKISNNIKSNLPTPTNEFIGREDEIDELLTYISLDYRSAVIKIQGIGGVGKTALVLKVAYLCYKESCQKKSTDTEIQTFDNFIFVSAKESQILGTKHVFIPPSKITKNLREICQYISEILDDRNITKATLDEDILEATYKSLSRDGKRSLLIIDNMETVGDKDAILSFLANLPQGSKAIITTRERIVMPPYIDLESLPENDCIQLINQQLKEHKKIISDVEDFSNSLYERIGGVPIAIIYSIGLLAKGYPLDYILNRNLSINNDLIGKFCFQKSFEIIKENNSYKVLLAIVIFRKSPKTEAVFSVTGIESITQFEQAFVQLVELSLASSNEERCKVLPMTREYTIDELKSDKELELQFRERWIKWYLEFAKENGYEDWSDWVEKHEKINNEWRNLLDVLDWCHDKGRYEERLEICGNVYVTMLLSMAFWNERIKWLDILIEKSMQHGEWSTAINFMSEKAYTLIEMNEEEKAYALLDEAYKLRKKEDVVNHIFLLQHQAILLLKQSKFTEALKCLEEEEQLFIDSNIWNGKYQKRRYIAINYRKAKIYYEQGKVELAKELYEELLDLAIQIGWSRRRLDINMDLIRIDIESEDIKDYNELRSELDRILYEVRSCNYKLGIAKCSKLIVNLMKNFGCKDENIHIYEEIIKEHAHLDIKEALRLFG